MTTVTLHCDACGQQYVTSHTQHLLAVYDAAEDGWTVDGPPGAMQLICRGCRCDRGDHAWRPDSHWPRTALRWLTGRRIAWRCPHCDALARIRHPITTRSTPR